MKIRLKAFSIIGLSSALLALLTIFIFRWYALSDINTRERETVYQNYHSSWALLQKDQDNLNRLTLDWSVWTDTYNFILDKNEKYINSNLVGSTLNDLNLNFMLFYNENGSLIYSKVNTREKGPELDLLIKANDPNNLKLFSSLSKNPKAGLYSFGAGVVMLSVAPVTSTDRKAEPNGYIVIGRYIEHNYLSYMEEVLQVGIKIKSVNDLTNSQDKDVYNTKYGDVECQIKKTNDSIISYTQLEDIYGKKSLYINQEFKRDYYKNKMLSLNYFGSIFFLAIVLISFVCIIMIDKIVTNPLRKVHDFMWNVAKTLDTSARINIPGKDEIAELGYLTNNMLQRLDESYEEMRLLQERFSLTLEATNDGYFDLDMLTEDIYISPSWLRYLGYNGMSPTMKLAQFLDSIIHKDDVNKFKADYNKCKTNKLEIFRTEIRAIKSSKQVIWIVFRGRVVQYDEEGKPERFICTIADITERKKLEDESTYLSQTDIVTGLKNRGYLENVMSRDEVYNYPTWIIMGDVNGLKLINDSFGHHEGDRLLKTIGIILLECCEKDDIPARWGGDEFVIYIKNKSEVYVENLIRCIRKACERVDDYPIKVSITLGSSSSDSELTSLSEVLKRAEERMYRHKLLESRSIRSGIIASLEQTLHEKHIETLEHTKRIRKMCVKVGNRIGLTREEMDELVLLGALHDIGKIGIPENILMKPDKLTDEEWKIMKKHSEIGYRIATATPELAHIADDILYHHERFDGTGYPHGLAGRDIPKLSRILSIVDSYDVMTHDRVYKSAMSVQEAVEELRKCSGKQFDPEIVELFISSLKLNL